MKHPWLLFTLLLSTPLYASHQWGDLDLCQSRRDTVPPGIAPNFLPEPTSAGAALLQRYCTQCHNLPGPGRHTREEWPGVLARMEALTRISRFFRGPLGPAEAPEQREQTELRAYLERNALHPLAPLPYASASAARQVYNTTCGDCHTAPDPRAYLGGWANLLARMEQHRATMARPPLTREQNAAIAAFAQEISTGALATPGGYDASVPSPSASNMIATPGRWLSLAVFFGLAALGVWRWKVRRC